MGKVIGFAVALVLLAKSRWRTRRIMGTIITHIAPITPTTHPHRLTLDH